MPAEGQIAAANHQDVLMGSHKVGQLWMKHAMFHRHRHHAVFNADSICLPFIQAALVAVRIGDDPKLAATVPQHRSLELAFEECQTQGVGGEKGLFPRMADNDI
ncbi:hypothetical protein [Prosthecobacter sp.]|uniref:hypothetical protein n=1 Tax=Prosthecobacter sp. TaxID=1965333 RepID=UPI00378311AB